MALQESALEHGSMVDFELTSVKIERVMSKNRVEKRACEEGFGLGILLACFFSVKLSLYAKKEGFCLLFEQGIRVQSLFFAVYPLHPIQGREGTKMRFSRRCNG